MRPAATHVQRLARVGLEVRARDADPRAVDIEPAVDRDRHVVLRDLVVLRHVGIEVVLAGEDRLLGHVELQAPPRRAARTPLPSRSRRAASPAARDTRGTRSCSAPRRTRSDRRRTTCWRSRARSAPRARSPSRARSASSHGSLAAPSMAPLLRTSHGSLATPSMAPLRPHHACQTRQRGTRSPRVRDAHGRSAQRRDDRLRARGRGRYPVAAAPRVPGDQADLVAQHRPARRRGLRGHRSRFPRSRRLEPRAGRLLRHRRVLDRLLHARARRPRSSSSARSRAATSAASCCTTSACAIRASRRARCSSTRCRRR